MAVKKTRLTEVNQMLKKNSYIPFTSKEIEPEGWLRRQLEIQAEGLSGNLDKIWPDIRDSRWIGGDKDGWERVPYWLDGFIPLAYLLKNEDMISRAKKYVDAIIAGQKPDGWICPCEDSERSRYDMWAAFLICKVLVVYYECSGDERIEGVLSKALHSLMLHIRGNTIFNWASARWFECLIPIYWLYERTGEEWLIYLANMLNVQGANYEVLFREWKDQKPRREWNFQTHVVNLAMAIKAPVLASRTYEEEDAVKKAEEFTEFMLDRLFTYHGTVYGHFTGDENLSGTSPIQGSELCSVVEAMYSYEQIFCVTGDPVWLDRAEMLAYNALPATTSPDMWTHQYDQMVNQVACVRFLGKPIFGTNGQDSHLFGLEPNFGCCTANHNQGWPKFALTTFMAYDGGVLSASIAPAKLSTVIGNTPVTVKLETSYPFGDNAVYTVTAESPVEFELAVRIPSCVRSARVGGSEYAPGTIARIKREWRGTSSLSVIYEYETKFIDRPNDLKAVRRGPFIYSVSIDEEWKMHEYVRDGVERKYPYCDYEIYPKSKWNYAYISDSFDVNYNGISDYPFSSENPPVTLKTKAVEIDWGTEEGYNDLCAAVPRSREPISEPVEITLKPYGCTNIRITEIPKLDV